MRKSFLAVIAMLLSFSSFDSAFAVIPKPKPRLIPSTVKKEGDSVDVDMALKQLQEKYPNIKIPVSSDIKWVAPTGLGAEADIQKALENGAFAFGTGEGEEAEDENAPTAEELKDIQRAQHWLDVKEDLALREIDNQALALVKKFAGAKNAVSPVQGINGAVSYAYGSSVPKIVCRPNRVTDIALQAGEKVTAVHAGDTVRWQISPAKSGAGSAEVVHVIVKPLMPDISTNIMIMTDKRTYNIDLVASNSDFIPAVVFTYPHDVMNDWQSFIAANCGKVEKDDELSPSYVMAAENLSFNYKIVDKNNVPWKPVRVFDDGTKTYIELPAKYKALEAPVVLFYEGKAQKIVNYRVKGRFYIVDRVMTQKAVLIAGKSQVIIVRGKGGSAGL